MVDVTARRSYPVLLAAIGFAISGCATPVGLGQQTDRQFQQNELDLSCPDLVLDMTPGIQSRGLHDTTIELAQRTPTSCGPVTEWRWKERPDAI